MSEADSAPRGRTTRSCERCGALNGADFVRCVRCREPLSPLLVHASRLAAHLDGKKLLATKGLLALTCLVFAGQLLAAAARGGEIPILSGGHPADALRYGAALISPGDIAAEPWRLLSAVFVHAGMLHIGMNMLALVNLSRAAEPMVGSARLAIAYAVTGIAGFATTLAWDVVTGGPGSFTLGASGAVFGVMGLILGYLLRLRDPRWKQFAGQAVLYSVLFGFFVNASGTGIRINNSAHIGGLLCGVALGALFAGRKRISSDLWANVGGALALAACVSSLALAQLSPVWRIVEQSLGR